MISALAARDRENAHHLKRLIPRMLFGRAPSPPKRRPPAPLVAEQASERGAA